MLLDQMTLFADGLAFDGVPEGLDLDSVRPGPGQPIKCFFTGSADLAGVTGITVLTSDTATADELILTVTGDPAGITVEFELPSTMKRYATVALGGVPSAGSFSCGVVMDVQTNT